HLVALKLKEEMALDLHPHSWLLQVLQKIHVHFPALTVPRARSPWLRAYVGVHQGDSKASSKRRVRERGLQESGPFSIHAIAVSASDEFTVTPLVIEGLFIDGK